MLFTSLVALLLADLTVSQTTGLGPYGCRIDSGISQLPACDRANATQYSCFAGQQTKSQNPAIQSCYCKQNVLNDLVDCESEFRLCYENNVGDGPLSTLTSQWSTWCSGFTTTSFTIPILSTLTTTVPTQMGSQADYCSQVALTSCNAFAAAGSSCLQVNPSATGASFLSCACKLSVLSLASVCLYDAPKTCYGITSNISSIPLFTTCGSTYINGQVIFTNALGNKTTSTAVTMTVGTTITSIASSVSSTTVPRTTTSTSSASSSNGSGSSSSSASTSASAQSSSSSAGSTMRGSLLQGSDREWASFTGVVVLGVGLAIAAL